MDSTLTLILMAALMIGGALITKAEKAQTDPTTGTTPTTSPRTGSCKVASGFANAGAICEWQAARAAKGEDPTDWAACWDHLKRLGLVPSYTTYGAPAGFKDYYK